MDDEAINDVMRICGEEPADPDTCVPCACYMEMQRRETERKLDLIEARLQDKNPDPRLHARSAVETKAMLDKLRDRLIDKAQEARFSRLTKRLMVEGFGIDPNTQEVNL